MESNPTIKQFAPVPPPRKLPIQVVFVLNDLKEASNEVLQAIRKFCQDQNLLVETRRYDSYRYNHDRDEIERLPALHLYINTTYKGTFYPNHRPLQVIQESIDHYRASLAIKQEKNRKWTARLHKWWKGFMSLGRRKTRLEKTQEQEAEEKAKVEEAIKRLSVSRRTVEAWK